MKNQTTGKRINALISFLSGETGSRRWDGFEGEAGDYRKKAGTFHVPAFCCSVNFLFDHDFVAFDQRLPVRSFLFELFRKFSGRIFDGEVALIKQLLTGGGVFHGLVDGLAQAVEIGRASCREGEELS